MNSKNHQSRLELMQRQNEERKQERERKQEQERKKEQVRRTRSEEQKKGKRSLAQGCTMSVPYR